MHASVVGDGDVIANLAPGAVTARTMFQRLLIVRAIGDFERFAREFGIDFGPLSGAPFLFVLGNSSFKVLMIVYRIE